MGERYDRLRLRVTSLSLSFVLSLQRREESVWADDGVGDVPDVHQDLEVFQISVDTSMRSPRCPRRI